VSKAGGERQGQIQSLRAQFLIPRHLGLWHPAFVDASRSARPGLLTRPDLWKWAAMSQIVWSKVAALSVAALLLAGAASDPQSEARFAAQRERMVETVASITPVAGVRGVRRIDRNVLDAMRSIPRHRLVEAGDAADAYEDRPLPIGHGQTISQPFIVALMTHLLAPRPDHVVLEVGTGSGYQAAILSRLVRRVYSIEIVPELAERSAARLQALGYANIVVRQGDGYAGWPEHAPFDGIIVTAGAERIPAPLLAQLKPGGRMVIPLGPSDDQQLVLVTKGNEGRFRQEVLLPVRFVPFTREGDGQD
jgi:protein-L-isoaspartate(D-aspartate) O-methyltransferase